MKEFLYSEEVQDAIGKHKEQLDFSTSLLYVTHNKLLFSLNKYTKTDMKDTSEYVIRLLLTQAIKTYKSSLILVREGYSQNALINIRNLLEIFFTTIAIINDTGEKKQLSKKYLAEQLKGVQWKADQSEEVALYDLYSILCDYTHSNIAATCKNINEGSFNIFPSVELTESVLITINAVYYYYIDKICDAFQINIGWKEISLPALIKDMVTTFEAHKKVLDKFCQYIPEKHQGYVRKQFIEWYRKTNKSIFKKDTK